MTICGELVCLAVVLSVFPVVMMMAAAAENSASGWMEVKGQRVALRHAFAVMSEDVLAGGDKERIEVLLSDEPVPVELRKATDAWELWASAKAQEGALHGIILYIDPDTKVWSRGQRLSKNGMEFYSQSVSSPELSDLVFAPSVGGPGEIAGKVRMKEPMRGVEESDGPWQVEAEFRTPVVARPAVTGNFVGDAARDSAPYKAVRAHLLACQKRDLEAIKMSLSPSSLETLSQFEEAQGKNAVLEMFAEEAAGTLRMKLTRVTVRGDTAKVIFSDGEQESSLEQAMVVVLDKGAWKIGQ